VLDLIRLAENLSGMAQEYFGACGFVDAEEFLPVCVSALPVRVPRIMHLSAF
jgi:hypothetical protein